MLTRHSVTRHLYTPTLQRRRRAGRLRHSLEPSYRAHLLIATNTPPPLKHRRRRRAGRLRYDLEPGYRAHLLPAADGRLARRHRCAAALLTGCSAGKPVLLHPRRVAWLLYPWLPLLACAPSKLGGFRIVCVAHLALLQTIVSRPRNRLRNLTALATTPVQPNRPHNRPHNRRRREPAGAGGIICKGTRVNPPPPGGRSGRELLKPGSAPPASRQRAARPKTPQRQCLGYKCNSAGARRKCTVRAGTCAARLSSLPLATRHALKSQLAHSLRRPRQTPPLPTATWHTQTAPHALTLSCRDRAQRLLVAVWLSAPPIEN